MLCTNLPADTWTLTRTRSLVQPAFVRDKQDVMPEHAAAVATDGHAAMAEATDMMLIGVRAMVSRRVPRWQAGSGSRIADARTSSV